MVMKRYPNGIEGKFFFMKRAPDTRPKWIETCKIAHSSGSVIDFPMIQDLPSLLWVINLGCIDLNQYMRLVMTSIAPTSCTSISIRLMRRPSIRCEALHCLFATDFRRWECSRSQKLAVPEVFMCMCPSNAM